MHARLPTTSGRSSPSPWSRLGRLIVLLLPLGLLTLSALRQPNQENPLLWTGLAGQALVTLLAIIGTRLGRELSSTIVILLYVMTLGFLALGATGRQDWLNHISRSVVLVVPVVFFAMQCLHDSGATTIRRARQLAAQLAARTDWPADRMQCRFLPEVKALRECLHVDASPALDLLADTRPAVRVAALAALEYRLNWRPGQSEIILNLARRAPEPEVRSTAVNALANIDDRRLIESLGELLRDRSPLVRQSAAEALLWNGEQRWHWLRDAVRQALNDPNCLADGALKLGGNGVTEETLEELHAWSAEKGLISQRAALTLGAYYGHALAGGGSPDLADRLRQRLVERETPTLLRLELARLLSQQNELDPVTLRQLLRPTMSAPIRLIGAERLLALGPCPEAVAALHELARLPNREIALATAEVVQSSLGFDMGVPRGQPLPAIHTLAAADVARRVLTWANRTEDAATPLPAQDSRTFDHSESHVQL